MKKIILIPALIVIFIIVFGILFAILKSNNNKSHLGKIKEGNMKLTTVFADGDKIPSQYTCDGEDLAPELKISQVPEGAKSLVLIVDDPDAPMGIWVHWLLYNIPTDTTEIDANNLPKGTKSGITDFGRVGWGGPCPPSGTHRYFFKLYAVDKTLDLLPGATKAQLEAEIKDHVIEKSELIGLYKRNKN